MIDAFLATLDKRTIVKQAAIAGTVGIGYFCLQRVFSKGAYTERVRAHPSVVSYVPDLAKILSELDDVLPAHCVDAMLDDADQLVALDRSPTRKTQWVISRLNGNIVRRAKEATRAVVLPVDEYVKHVRLEDELVPRLEACLQNVLHNHILKTM